MLFAKEGAHVIATDLDVSKVSELLTTPGIVKAIKLDVLKKEDVQNLAKQVGRIDVLFNCAGLLIFNETENLGYNYFLIHRWVPNGTIMNTSDETWDLAMNLNVKGAFWMTQTFVDLSLKENKPLSVVHMSSACGTIKGVPNRFAYGVSKGALIALSKSVAAVCFCEMSNSSKRILFYFLCRIMLAKGLDQIVFVQEQLILQVLEIV